jgi:hypothetical protein
MFYNITTKLSKKLFDFQIRGILNTPPIEYREDAWTILSMISHSDLLMYLLAIKSFYGRLGSGKILVINDGTLTEEDKRTLRAHLISLTIVGRDVISIGSFLRHIMWERLAYAVALSASEYVIQLDADTLTIGPIEEARICASENRPFILGTGTGQKLVSVAEASAFAAAIESQHIQIIAEKALARLPDAEMLKYVRGSAGLAGLARHGFSQQRAEAFCLEMTYMIGDRFKEWGTDQVAFNFIVSNSAHAVVLPFPAYCVSPEQAPGVSRFLHFIGSHRFDAGEYARQGRHFIANSQAIA